MRVLILFMSISVVGAPSLLNAQSGPASPAAPLSVQYLEGTQEQRDRAYSPAVVTEGGRIVWLAGQSGGGSPGDFTGQARSIFDRMQETLERSGGSLQDIVSMKVFIKSDARSGDDLVKLVQEYFPDGKYPASSVVTVAYAASLIEIQAVAVLP